MLPVYVLISLLVLVLFIGALVDIIMHDQSQIKHLPKVLWILIVILMPLIGSALWFAIGREYARPVGGRQARGWPRRDTDAVPPPSVPGQMVAQTPGVFGVRNTEAELAALEREIAANETADRIRQLEAELRARRGIEGPKD
jgi:hypothetical protein